MLNFSSCLSIPTTRSFLNFSSSWLMFKSCCSRNTFFVIFLILLFSKNSFIFFWGNCVPVRTKFLLNWVPDGFECIFLWLISLLAYQFHWKVIFNGILWHYTRRNCFSSRLTWPYFTTNIKNIATNLPPPLWRRESSALL